MIDPESAVASAPRSARPAAGRGAWVLGIFLLALAVRLFALVEMRDDVLFDHPAIDQADYVEWARLIASSGYSEPTPFPRPPGLPYALAAVFRLAGDGLLLPRVLQAVLSAAVCVFVFLLGRRWFSARVGLVAACVTALHGAQVHAATEIMPTTWVLFLDALGLWLLVRAADRRSWRWALGCGVVLGMSALFLPTVLLLVPVALWALRRRTTAAAAVLIGIGLLVLPVTVRNGVRGHDFVLVAANDGINFFIGNNPEYDRTFAIRPGREYMKLEWEPIERGHEKPSEQSAYYWRAGLRFFVQDPVRALGLQLRKLYLFVDGPEIPRSSDVYLARAESRLLSALVWPGPLYVPNGLVMPFALVGIVFAWGRRRELLVPLGFLATQVIGVCMFFVCGRYRVPSLPAWTLFAVAGGFALWSSMRHSSVARRVSLALTVLALLALFNLPTRELRVDLRGDEAYFRAQGALEAGDLPQARAQVQRCIALQPLNNDAWDLLGHVYDRTGKPDSALAAWRHAAALDPLKAETARTIARVLEKRGDIDGAIAALQSSIVHLNDPHNHGNDYSIDLVFLARLHAGRQDYDQALAAVRAAREFNPANTGAADLETEILRRRAGRTSTQAVD